MKAVIGAVLLGAAGVAGWSLAAASGPGRAGAQPADGDAIPVVTIVASDYKYQAPATVPTGVVRFRLVNNGPELHHVQLMRLKDGKTAKDLVQAMAGHGPPPAWAEPVGGPNAPMPGGDTTYVVQTLEPGTYALLCIIPSADKVPHMAKGMYASFEAKGPARHTAEPRADVEMRLFDYNYKLSGPVAPGRRLIKVVNDGPQLHEVVLMQFAPGKTLKDLRAWAETEGAGPPPGKLLGGVVALAPGKHSIVEANFAPGEYGLLCFLPDAKDGRMHIAHGMIQGFTVGPASTH